MSWAHINAGKSHGAGIPGGEYFGEPLGPSRNPIRTDEPRAPFVPIGEMRALLRRLVEELGGPTVAALAGINTRAVWRIMNESSGVVSFPMADRLITDALDDPSLWRHLTLCNQLGEPL
jgi:hypothetical protein